MLKFCINFIRKILAVLVLVGAPVKAETITYDFSGSWVYTTGDFNSILGQSFSGSFSYDPNLGLYGFSHFSYNSPVDDGINRISSGIMDWSKLQTDQFEWSFYITEPASPPAITYRFTFLDNQSQLVVDTPPDGNARLSSYTSAIFTIQKVDNFDLSIAQGEITALVPEPSSLSLLLAGGAVVIAKRKKI